MTDRREAFGPRQNVSDEVLLFELREALRSLLVQPHVKMHRPDSKAVTRAELLALLDGDTE